MSTSISETRTAAARAVEATKVYGSGGTAVIALDEVTVDLRRAVDETGQTVVMVTHDPGAAAHADTVVFLADGRIVDRMADPTADRVIDTIKRLGS